jgi:Zn finger protein HypA/HybF involved in hydrogenase expression
LVVFAKGDFFIMTDAKEVKFIFVCPNENETFESSEFKIIDNRGVTVGDDGSKTLDAKVALNEACPFCGQKHVYLASELSCPFAG